MGKYNLDSILNELKKSEAGSEKKEFSSDFYKVTLDKDATELEVILRFLPNPDSTTSVPWVFRQAHMIKFANGQFLYEPCPKKAKKGDCPICEEVNAMYESQNPKLEATGGKQCAKKRYFHNVLVVKDARNNGENEGKVLIFEYGPQVQTILREAMEDEDDAIVYFDPEDGANLKLKIIKSGEFPNYTKSKFMKPSALEVKGKSLDEDEADAFIEKNCHKLNEKLMGDKVFKSYDDLRSLYDNQGIKKASTKGSASADDEDDDKIAEEIIAKAAKKKEKEVVEKKVAPKAKVEEDEDDDDTTYTADADDDDDDAELRALLAD